MGTPPTPEPGGGGANACPSAEGEVLYLRYKKIESMKLALEAGKEID